MADADNFEEEDLFADLYTEDDAAPKAPAAEVKSEPADVAPPTDVKNEASPKEEDQGGGEDQQMYNGDQDADDDIDFNLGNGNDYDSPAQHEAHGPGIKEDG